MSDEIVNRVANSALIAIDLADYAPSQSIAVLVFERMIEYVDGHYDILDKSNYQEQDGPALAKFFSVK